MIYKIKIKSWIKIGERVQLLPSSSGGGWIWSLRNAHATVASIKDNKAQIFLDLPINGVNPYILKNEQNILWKKI